MSKTAKTMIVSLLVSAAMFGAVGGAMAAADHQPPRAAGVIAADTPGSTSPPDDMTWG